MSDTSAFLGLGVIVLVTVIVAGRGYMAWLRLKAISVALAARAETLDRRTDSLAGSFGRLRRDVAEMDAQVESGHAALAGTDAAVVAAAASLRTWRLRLDGFRTTQLSAAETMLARARTTARVVRTAIKLRRSLWA